MGSSGSMSGTASGATASGVGSSATGTMNQNGTSAGIGSNSTHSTMQPSSNQSGSSVQPGSAAQGVNGSAPAPGSLVARNGNVAIRTTSVPGVLLANDIHGLPFSNASGLLLGARRDVHLDSGTRLVVAVAMAPQSNGSGMTR